MDLDRLPDHACCRVVVCDPAMDASGAESLCIAIHKLGQQFVREGRCEAMASALLADGAALIIAWTGAAQLSGCSHDKLNALMARHSERTGVALLDAPPLLVATATGTRAYTHAGLKAALLAGEVRAEDHAYETLATTLGQWRAEGCRPLNEHWLAPLVARAVAAG